MVRYRDEQTERERRARVMARLAIRVYRRELGGYRARDLIGALDSAVYLLGNLKAAINAGDGPTAVQLVDHIQEKVATASLGAATILGIAASSTKYSS